ncbi:MAG: deoxynucleoside kinase [Chloroflexi bacterium]|nr:deoxynucleoside kinase [Chloroflexota bacterium]
MAKETLFMAIAGNIGVGKSSLTRMLADALGWEPFFEAVDENPYLEDFYDDMQMWSFHSQVFFLSRRLQHHRKLLDFPGHVLQDRSVYEDAEIFARNLYQQEKMSKRDYQCYLDLYLGVRSFLPPPDLLIYLQAPVGVLAERIAQRGRDYERSISIAYLTDLNRLYDEWIAGWTLCPIYTIHSEGKDFVNDSMDFERIIEGLRAQLTVIKPNVSI